MRLPPDLSDVLERQAGALTRRQALERGLTRDRVDGLVARGAWQAPFRGVYVAHSGPLLFPTRAWAGLLAAGPGAALSGVTAAALHGLVEPGDHAVRVSVPVNRRLRPRPGLEVRLDTNLARKVHPVRLPTLTRVEDTVLDLADDAASLSDVTTWVTRGCQRRLTTPARLSEALARRKRIAWRGALEAMVGDVAEGAESPLELRYLRRVERPHGLPRGTRQQRRSGRRVIWVDVDLPAYATRVELDGRTGHVEEGAFRDRRRDNRGAVEGMTTLRYGHIEVFGAPCAVAIEVATVIAQRGWDRHLRRCGPACLVPG